MKKKGQGLSLTTIIVAAVGLIVLVVLVAIFTGNMSQWLGGVSKAAQEELAAMQIRYSDCHPSRGMENTFTKALDDAETATDDLRFRKFRTRMYCTFTISLYRINLCMVWLK